MKEEKNLLPCPFCGSTDLHFESIYGTRFVRCQKCSATGGYVFNFQNVPYTKETVIERWNTRTLIGLEESSLAKLWDTPEEDEAWKDL